MKKIEELLNIDLGRKFDTPKKLNRSNAVIQPQTIESLEGGEFTAEMIEGLSKTFPIFYYRTCITVHGEWPEVSRTRIGGYKNVHQNQNGSVEIRYSAIDKTKIDAICDGLRGVGSRFHFSEDSNTRSFRWYETVTRETLADKRAIMEPVAKLLASLPVYGYVNLYLAQTLFSTVLVLDVHPLAVKSEHVHAVVLALADCDQAEYDRRRALHLEAERLEKEKRDKERAELHARQAVITAAIDARVNELLPAISDLPESTDLNAGILVKVYRGRTVEETTYLFIKLEGNGSFGRVKYAIAKSNVFALDGLQWTPGRKQVTLSELNIKYTRIAQPKEVKHPDRVIAKNFYGDNVSVPAVRVKLNTEKKGIELYFNAKPSADVLNDLKSNSFRWSGFNQCWYNTDTPSNREKVAKFSTVLPWN